MAYLRFTRCLAVLLCLSSVPLHAASVLIQWVAPTTNADGTALTDLAGHRVLYGTTPDHYGPALDVGLATQAEVKGLTEGTTYWFTVTAYDTSGHVSVPTSAIAFTVPGSPPVPIVPVPPVAMLVAAYSFDEGCGSTVADRSGAGHHGTRNGATWSTRGKYGAAMSFDGNDRVDIPDAPALRLTASLTLMAWVYPATTLTGWRTLIQKEPVAYYLHASSDTTRPAFGVFIGEERMLYTKTRLAPQVWTHVASTYDGQHQRVYLNGVEVSSRAQTGLVSVTTGSLRLGGNARFGEYFQGRLDEVRLYNTALSALAIQVAMSTPLP